MLKHLSGHYQTQNSQFSPSPLPAPFPLQIVLLKHVLMEHRVCFSRGNITFGKGTSSKSLKFTQIQKRILDLVHPCFHHCLLITFGSLGTVHWGPLFTVTWKCRCMKRQEVSVHSCQWLCVEHCCIWMQGCLDWRDYITTTIQYTLHYI